MNTTLPILNYLASQKPNLFAQPIAQFYTNTRTFYITPAFQLGIGKFCIYIYQLHDPAKIQIHAACNQRSFGKDRKVGSKLTNCLFE